METSRTEELLQDIQDKYRKLKQNPDIYLEGLKHSRPVTYWDYCEIDTLLSLQKPRTIWPDEEVFILYHQVTELLFKMILSEMKQISNASDLCSNFFIERLGRINRYWDVLISSFSIMSQGMEVEQYMQFRTTLTPASGFQSAQYRTIEICATDINHLVDHRFRDRVSVDSTPTELLNYIYWQAGGKDHETGEKTLTLKTFEGKYLSYFQSIAIDYRNKNIWKRYLTLKQEDRENEELISAMRSFDFKVNIEWPMAHFKTASKYLDKGSEVVEATGGSSWKKYMHPRYQRRIFFPALWSKDELASWGR